MNADNPTPGAPYVAVAAFIRQQMRRLRIPGVSLAIVEGDRIAHLRGFGRACPGGGTPAPQTPFFVGSLTKSFTALAVLQLAESGKVSLAAPVQRYLPWFRVADPAGSAQITVRHLLNQTSGLPASAGEIPLADFDAVPGAAERQARALSTLRPAHPPGSAFEYSNANYVLLGLIVEVASGESYADYIRTHIFAPLQMTHSYATKEEAVQDGLAVGHRYWFGLPFPAPETPLPHGSLASGLLISSAEDMARYLIAQMNGGAQLLSPAGMNEMHRGVAEYRKFGIAVGRYGMGWYESDFGNVNGRKVIWHSGILPDFFAYAAFLPGQRKGVILLVNADQHWMSPALTDVGIGVTKLLAGERPGPLRFGFMPWALRGLLLIPALQVVSIATALHHARRPVPRRTRRGLRLLLSGAHLLMALGLLPLLGRKRGYLRLYMPDYTLIALVCGCFALAWGVLRAALALSMWKKAAPPACVPGTEPQAPRTV